MRDRLPNDATDNFKSTLSVIAVEPYSGYSDVSEGEQPGARLLVKEPIRNGPTSKRPRPILRMWKLPLGSGTRDRDGRRRENTLGSEFLWVRGAPVG